MKSLPAIAWVLLGLLIIGAAVLSLGREDTSIFPSASSYAASGASAFMNLAIHEGYRTKIDLNPNPVFEEGDVPVGFQIGGDSLESLFETRDTRDPMESIHSYCRHSGKAIILDLPSDYAQFQSDDSNTQVSNLVGSKTTFGVTEAIAKVQGYSEGDSVTVAIDSDKQTFASASFEGKGTYLEVYDGIIATNHFIDRQGNAAEAMQLLKMVAPPGARLVFAEATFGNAIKSGVLGIIGPWAVAGWWQLMLLGLVIVYTLGKPFGYPDEERSVQKCARYLVDAVAVTYRRSRATQVAMKWLHLYADREVRRKAKLSTDASERELNRQIPGSLALVLTQAKTSSQYPIEVQDAIRIASRLDAEVRAFVGKPPRRIKKRRKY